MDSMWHVLETRASFLEDLLAPHRAVVLTLQPRKSAPQQILQTSTPRSFRRIQASNTRPRNVSAHTQVRLSHFECDFRYQTTRAQSIPAMENSRLNKLPGELRNRIYRYALVPGTGIGLDMDDMSFVTSGTNTSVISALNLLSTCK